MGGLRRLHDSGPIAPPRPVQDHSHQTSRGHRRDRDSDDPTEIEKCCEAQVDTPPVAVRKPDTHGRAGDTLCLSLSYISINGQVILERRYRGRGKCTVEIGILNRVAIRTVMALASSMQNPREGDISVSRFPRLRITLYPY